MTKTLKDDSLKNLLLTSEKETELQLLKSLAERLGIKAYMISDEEREDIGLYKAMLEGKKEDYVKEELILKELKK